MNRPILSLAATLALAGGTHAAVIVDNFENYSPLFGDMTGQGGWTVTNGVEVGTGDPVVIVDSFTWDASTQSATVGGLQPTSAAITSLYHSASVPFVSVDPTPTSFKIETAYLESDNGFRNNYQFVLSSSSGANNNLLTIDLTPGAAGQYNVAWSSDFATGGTFGFLEETVFSPLDVNSTQFQLDMWASGLNVAYSFSNQGSVVSSGILSGASQTDLITGFAVNWDSTTGGGVGNGVITIDNVSLVPEPTSAMLGLLGASFVFLRRRRA